MRRKSIIIWMLWCVAITAAAQVTGEEALKALQEWKAGTTVTLEAVNAYGPERCFAAEEIPADVSENALSLLREGGESLDELAALRPLLCTTRENAGFRFPHAVPQRHAAWCCLTSMTPTTSAR